MVQSAVWFIPFADVCENCEIPWEHVPYLSALEVWSRQGTIQIHIYRYLTHGLVYKRLICSQLLHHRKTTSDVSICNSQWIMNERIMKATQRRLEFEYYWPRMKKMIAQHVRRCERCQRVAPVRARDRAPLQPITCVKLPTNDCFPELSTTLFIHCTPFYPHNATSTTN